MANDFQPVLDSLIADVSALTKQAAADVKPWAEKYAAELTEYAAALAQANAAGDAEAAARATASIKQVKDSAVLDAAILGVKLQEAGESALFAIIDKAVGLVGKL